MEQAAHGISDGMYTYKHRCEGGVDIHDIVVKKSRFRILLYLGASPYTTCPPFSYQKVCVRFLTPNAERSSGLVRTRAPVLTALSLGTAYVGRANVEVLASRVWLT